MSARPLERRRWGIDKTHGEEALERIVPLAEGLRARYDRLEAVNADLLAALEGLVACIRGSANEAFDSDMNRVCRVQMKTGQFSDAETAIDKAKNTHVTGQGIRPASD